MLWVEWRVGEVKGPWKVLKLHYSHPSAVAGPGKELISARSGNTGLSEAEQPRWQGANTRGERQGALQECHETPYMPRTCMHACSSRLEGLCHHVFRDVPW